MKIDTSKEFYEVMTNIASAEDSRTILCSSVYTIIGRAGPVREDISMVGAEPTSRSEYNFGPAASAVRHSVPLEHDVRTSAPSDTRLTWRPKTRPEWGQSDPCLKRLKAGLLMQASWPLTPPCSPQMRPGRGQNPRISSKVSCQT